MPVRAASAAFHESPRIMLAAVKFFLGQDEAADNSGDEGDDDTVKAVNPTKAEIYNASKKASARAPYRPSASVMAGVDGVKAEAWAGIQGEIKGAKHDVQALLSVAARSMPVGRLCPVSSPISDAGWSSREASAAAASMDLS